MKKLFSALLISAALTGCVSAPSGSLPNKISFKGTTTNEIQARFVDQYLSRDDDRWMVTAQTPNQLQLQAELTNTLQVALISCYACPPPVKQIDLNFTESADAINVYIRGSVVSINAFGAKTVTPVHNTDGIKTKLLSISGAQLTGTAKEQKK